MNFILCAQQGHTPHRSTGVPFDYVRDAKTNVIEGCIDICMRCQVLFFSEDYKGMTMEELAASYASQQNSELSW